MVRVSRFLESGFQLPPRLGFCETWGLEEMISKIDDHDLQSLEGTPYTTLQHITLGLFDMIGYGSCIPFPRERVSTSSPPRVLRDLGFSRLEETRS
jgi:hypothetical protein